MLVEKNYRNALQSRLIQIKATITHNISITKITNKWTGNFLYPISANHRIYDIL